MYQGMFHIGEVRAIQRGIWTDLEPLDLPDGDGVAQLLADAGIIDPWGDEVLSGAVLARCVEALRGFVRDAEQRASDASGWRPWMEPSPADWRWHRHQALLDGDGARASCLMLLEAAARIGDDRQRCLFYSGG